MIAESVSILLARAVEQHRRGRFSEAEAGYEQVLSLEPDNADGLAAMASLRLRQGRVAEAVNLCDRALGQRPTHEASLINRANALRVLGQHERALADYDQCTAANPANHQAWSNRAVILFDLRRYAEAVESCDRAIALAPSNPDAFNNRGIALASLGRMEEAIASYDAALAAEPRDARVHGNRAVALLARFRLEEALESADKAIGLQPGFAQGHLARGNVLRQMRRYTEALESLDAAAAIAPEIPYLQGTRLFLKLQLCDWAGLDALYEEVVSGIRNGRRMITPWSLIATPASAELQKRCAEIFVADHWPVAAVAAPRSPGNRIRLGYFSADFHGHPTSYLVAELIELHDRTRFEVTGFSFGPSTQEPMRKRMESAFDHFLDVTTLSDGEVAALSRRREIDIAVDLKGLTQDARPGIFAARAAPVQVNYLGHPGTTGAPFMDYIVADETVIPVGAEAHYTERVVRLPGCYQPNDRNRPIASPQPDRASLGLPEEAFVFCCFHSAFKISPAVFAIWSSVLRRVPGSVIWFLAAGFGVEDRLRQAAQERGIDPGRLVFAPRADLDRHLSRMRAADLFLDTFPCGAHTTASDALWAGLPVVTRLGDTFASRVAASLLHAVDMPELIATSDEQYERLAVELALAPERLAAIRERLAAQRLNAVLFDTPTYARGLERAYRDMLEAKDPGA